MLHLYYYLLPLLLVLPQSHPLPYTSLLHLPSAVIPLSTGVPYSSPFPSGETVYATTSLMCDIDDTMTPTERRGVIFVPRGGCDVGVKGRNGGNLGFDGVVVYGNPDFEGVKNVDVVDCDGERCKEVGGVVHDDDGDGNAIERVCGRVRNETYYCGMYDADVSYVYCGSEGCGNGVWLSTYEGFRRIDWDGIYDSGGMGIVTGGGYRIESREGMGAFGDALTCGLVVCIAVVAVVWGSVREGAIEGDEDHDKCSDDNDSDNEGNDGESGRNDGENERTDDENVLSLSPAHGALFLLTSSFTLVSLFYLDYARDAACYAYLIGGCATAGWEAAAAAAGKAEGYVRYMCKRRAGMRCANKRRVEEEKSVEKRWGYAAKVFVTSIFALVGAALGYANGNVRGVAGAWWYYVPVDYVGCSMCSMILSSVRSRTVGSVKVIMALAFLYDVFFVFVSPAIFGGRSVMVDVASGRDQEGYDPVACENVPSLGICKASNPLPMLITVPVIGDYFGGVSMLGLGDIVVPGLLISHVFRRDAERYSRARREDSLSPSSRSLSSQSQSQSQSPSSRSLFSCTLLSRYPYFLPCLVAYAFSLSVANVAVHLTGSGQPALLYVVPITVAAIEIVERRRGEGVDDVHDGGRGGEGGEEEQVMLIGKG